MFLSVILRSKRIRPSTLRVRLPKVGLSDDSKHIKQSLHNIYKQLIPSNTTPQNAKIPNNVENSQNSKIISKSGPTSDNSEANNTLENATTTHLTNTTGTSIKLNNDVGMNIIIDRRNKYHKRLWQSMKRRDLLYFERLVKEFRNSGIEFTSTSYTLIFNGFLIFYKKQSLERLRELIEEMKENGVHPALIRFLSRLMCVYLEMAHLNSMPLTHNWLSITRSSWLISYLIHVKS